MNRRAFTLFEVLIAMSIVAILLSTMATTISVAFKQKRAAEEAVDAVRDIQTVGDIFVEDVACAVPPNPQSASADSIAYQVDATQQAAELAAVDPTAANIVASGGINGMTNSSGISSGTYYLFGPFNGDSSSLTFYTTGPEPKAAIQGDVRYVEYALSSQSDGRLALVRRVDTNLLSDQVGTDMAEEVLVTGVISVAYQYYDGNNWMDSWDSTDPSINNTLPVAVKMVLQLQPSHAGGDVRVITRIATVWCAQKTMLDSNNSVAASQAAETQSTTGN